MDEMINSMPNPVFSPAGTNRGELYKDLMELAWESRREEINRKYAEHYDRWLHEELMKTSLDTTSTEKTKQLATLYGYSEKLERQRVLRKKMNRRKKQARARTGRRN